MAIFLLCAGTEYPKLTGRNPHIELANLEVGSIELSFDPTHLLQKGLTGANHTQYTTEYVESPESWPTMSIRHALLALLSEEPKFGLRLQQEFEDRTGEVWPLNVGQVYTTLQRLERDGLVASDESQGPQKDFSITQAGFDELVSWLRTPPPSDIPPRDELVIKVLVAVQVPGVNVRDIIQAHRRHLIETMQRFTHLKAGSNEKDIGLALVLDAELFRLEGVVRWLDAADTRLGQILGADEGKVTAGTQQLSKVTS